MNAQTVVIEIEPTMAAMLKTQAAAQRVSMAAFADVGPLSLS